MRYYSLAKAYLTRKIPAYVHYGITHRCNLTCSMCELWKEGDRSGELSTTQIEALARRLGRLGVAVISIGGGEPFLRDDLEMVIKAFTREDISTRVLSNGVLVSRERLKQLARAGLRHISISLDSLRENLQDEICNAPGTWRKATGAIEAAGAILTPGGGLGLINTVVSRRNLEELPEMVGFARQHGFHVSLVPIEIHHRPRPGGGGCADYAPGMGFSPDDHQLIDEVYDRLLAMKRSGEPIFNSSSLLRKSKAWLKGERVSWPCLAGRLYFSLDPEGNFSICHAFLGYREEPKKISILSAEFEELFRSADYRSIARQTVASCGGCLRPCWAEISEIFTSFTSLREMAAIMLGKGARPGAAFSPSGGV